jgi:AraC-like DNA-binding protein
MGRELGFFNHLQRICADGRNSVDGEAMFGSVREFSFDRAQTGWLTTEVVRLGQSGVEIWRVRSSGHNIGLAVPGPATILLPVTGTLTVQANRREFHGKSGEAFAFDEGERRTIVRPGKSGVYTAAAVKLPGRRHHQANGTAFKSGRLSAAFSAYLRFLFLELCRGEPTLGELRAQEAAALLLQEYFGNALEDRIGPDGQEVADTPASGSQVRRAEDLMFTSYANPISIAAIAQEIGVGERSLQIAFKRHRGIGPRETLNRIRLQMAQERLKRADDCDSVSAIALDCGFGHFGRFSVAYRKLFGESPSVTLGRGRGRN